MKKVIYFLLVLVFLGIGFFLFLNRDRGGLEISPDTKMVAFGDSLVYGTGATSGNNFVSKLSIMLGVEITNLGNPGDTTSDGLSRIDEVKKEGPDIAVVLLGGNDALRNIPRAETFANLNQIISELEAEGIKVVLLGIQGGLFTIADPYEKEFEKLVEGRDIIYVPNVMSGIFGNKEYMSDSIHPNDAGHQKIAEKVFKYIKG